MNQQVEDIFDRGLVLLAVAIACSLAAAAGLDQPKAQIDTLFNVRWGFVLTAGGLLLVLALPFFVAYKGPHAAASFFCYALSAPFISIALGALIYSLNYTRDTSRPITTPMTVEKKVVVGRGPQPYRLNCVLGGTNIRIVLPVSKSYYAQVVTGETLVASIHKGAFGMRWISEFSQVKSM